MVRQVAFLACLLLVTLTLEGAADSGVPVPFGQTTVVQVNQPWTGTGHLVSEFSAVVIVSHGEYSMGDPAEWWNWVGPQGSLACADETYPVPGAPIGCLIARIGGGTPFAVGRFGCFIAQVPGELEFGTNDLDFDSNDGMLKVSYDNWPDISAVGPAPGARGAIDLQQNRPNPLNSGTTIAYSVSTADVVELTVYDASGGFIIRLVEETQTPGEYTITWDGRDARGRPVPTGVYFYELKVGESAGAGKMIVLR